MSARINIFVWPFGLVALASMFYVGSYFLIVSPQPKRLSVGMWVRVPHYRISSDLIERAYAPLVRFDQRNFPRRWEWSTQRQYQQWATTA